MVDVEVSVMVDVSGWVVVDVVVVGCVVDVDDVVVVVVVEDEVVEVVDGVVVEAVVVSSLPLSLATTASATPSPITTATRRPISAFMPPLMPRRGGSPGGWP